MEIGMLKEIVIGIALVSLIGAAVGIALEDFGTDQNTGNFVCGLNGTPGYNITCDGLTGTLNTTSYLGTIGTIAGVAVLIAIVIGAFYFATRQ